MIGEIWTYVRPNPTIEWWEDYGVRTNNTQIIEFDNYWRNFLNSSVDTNLGESWSLEITNPTTKTFTIQFANNENYESFMQRYRSDPKIHELVDALHSYCNEFNITEHCNLWDNVSNE